MAKKLVPPGDVVPRPAADLLDGLEPAASDVEAVAPTDEWPPYHDGLRDHLHAIGVLLANWNKVEFVLHWYVYAIFPSNLQSGQRVFEQLKHDGREKFIKTEVEIIGSSDEKELVSYFFECVNIIKDNRNLFAHNDYLPITSADMVLIAKKINKSNPSMKQISTFSVLSLREMADAANTFADFGLNLVSAIQVRLAKERAQKAGLHEYMHFPLPKKPPRPRKWEEILRASTQPPLQP